MNRLVLFLPVAVFGVIALMFLKGLGKDQTVLPSNLINKPVPDFTLVDMPDMGPVVGKAFTPDDLKGQVTLVNVFGSWCAACRLEHSTLIDIKESGTVPLYGINWADTPARGAAWLKQWGNSYHRVGNDEGGRAIIGFGVTGAPETFLVDQQGRIRYRHVGPVTPDFWKKTLAPMVRELQNTGAIDGSAVDPA